MCHVMKYLLTLFLSIGMISACVPLVEQSPNRTTNTRSTEFSTAEEKIAFLGQYLKLHSGIQETEFHIIYKDNSTGRVPGPSDWIILAVIKSDPEVLPAWTAERTPIDPTTVDLAQWQEVLPKTEKWYIQSEPIAYQSGVGTLLVVYEAEGILLFRSSTMG